MHTGSKVNLGYRNRHDLLCFTVGFDSSHGELIAIPVVGCTVAVDTEKQRAVLGE
ncbi:hypothetical protein [Haloarcula rubripromontorii]|uniref:hypothetical protein n=1 Tax=Haloarcula rubripromontorii TaxID=1705562 RepID=UPI0012FEE557|nr:hypothetical protein [Haloarcula taiwanensis]